VRGASSPLGYGGVVGGDDCDDLKFLQSEDFVRYWIGLSDDKDKASILRG
jgi:hypothetical protein